MKITLIAWALAASLLTTRLPAGEPAQPLTGFAREDWSARDGVPGAAWRTAQTTDGRLWFATERGLYWFDGIHFVRFEGTQAQPLRTDFLSTVYASPDGGLWMGFRLGGVAFLKDGVLAVYPPDRKNLPEATVYEIKSDRDGTLWIATTAGISRYVHGRWECIQASWGLPQGAVVNLVVDHAGTVWTRVAGRVFFLPRGAHRFTEQPNSFTQYSREIRGYLSEAPDGKLWVASLQGVRPLDGSIAPASAPERDVIMMFARDGAIWYERPGELWRYTNPDAVARGASPHLELLKVPNLVPSLPFEDREGNIWISTEYSPVRLTPTSLHLVVDGDSAGAYGLGVTSDGSVVWSRVAYSAPPTSIFRLANGKPREQLSLPDRITCIYRDPDGVMWFAGAKTLWHQHGAALESLPGPIEASKADDLEAQALARDGSGGLWFSMKRAGVFRLAEGKWQRNGNLPDLPQAPAITMVTDEAGRLWLGYAQGQLARVDRHGVRLFGSNDGLRIGGITALSARGEHLWVGGEHGLVRFNGTGFVPVHVANEAAFRSLWGIAETSGGELWVAATASIARLTHAQLEAVLRGEAIHEEIQIFDIRDGLPGSIRFMRPIPSMVEAGDGKLWFAFLAGVGYLDPAHLLRDTLPPPVLITGITAAGREYSPYARDIRLPVATTQLRIAYTANSFTVPERIRFRYQLEGLDQGWQDVGNRREATYTNVAPGTYRFHVLAANKDGVWNLSGATLSFTVLPAFYQTTWFYALCGIAAALLLYLVYHARMRQVAAAVRVRLEERITERERIARELHDTLLQGLQGLILRFQAVAARIPPHEAASEMMESALNRADEVLIESRDRVKDIRFSAQAAGDLPESLAALGEELSQAHPGQLSIEIQGAQRTLHPAARDEVLMIGREALSNAFRHACAVSIEAEIEFTQSELRLRIRDDGKGINAQMLEDEACAGRWGLRGMRERAAKIHAQLRIWSRPGLGTEVELRVPAAIAYGQRERQRPSWLSGKRATLPQES